MSALVIDRRREQSAETHACDYRAALEQIAAHANEPMRSRVTADDLIRLAQRAVGRKADRG